MAHGKQPCCSLVYRQHEKNDGQYVAGFSRNKKKTNLKMTQTCPNGIDEYQPQGKCFWRSQSQLRKSGQCRGGCVHTQLCRQSARWCWVQQSPRSLLILLVYQSPQSLWGSQWICQSRHKDKQWSMKHLHPYMLHFSFPLHTIALHICYLQPLIKPDFVEMKKRQMKNFLKVYFECL